MSLVVETPFGKLRKVEHEILPGDYDKPMSNYVWECPSCGSHGLLTLKQLRGEISIWCEPKGPCLWHETHDFRPYLISGSIDVGA